jgi:hypothetical protein
MSRLNLCDIVLHKTEVTDVGVKEFKQKLPNAQVIVGLAAR